MQLDPFTLIVFLVVVSFLMSAGLFALSRSYFSEVKGIRHWATALLLIGIGYVFLALAGVVADFFSMVMGSCLSLLALAIYYHALLLFKEVHKPVQWSYACVALAFIAHVYFVNIAFNLNAKIIVVALSVSILMLASAKLLFEKQQGICPVSHRLTGCVFAICGTVYVIRTLYYAFWYQQPENTMFHTNLI